MADKKKRSPRFIAAFIVLLVLVFLAIEFFIRASQEISPATVTDALLTFMQVIVLLLFLVLSLVLGRNLVKLYLERKRKIAGAHFKTKLVLFFIALSIIPAFLLFFFASDLISRNIELWFKAPFEKVMEDTKGLAEGVVALAEKTADHYARILASDIGNQKLARLENRLILRDFIRRRLSEYALDEIGIFLEDEELFTYLNPNLPLQNYQPLQAGLVRAAKKDGVVRSIEPMGNGEMVRRGVWTEIPGVGSVLVTAGVFFPQSYAQKIAGINASVERYRLLVPRKITVKTFYLISFMFVTLLIIFAASWTGLHLAKGITVPIEKLSQATREVSRGNLDIRVEDPASDELGMLIDSFNQMITDLRQSQLHIAQKTAELEDRKQYIEAVLNNITTGVITLDAEGRITTINPSAREMLALGDKNPVGKNYQHVLDEAKYSEIVKNIAWGMKNRYRLVEKEVNIQSNGQVTTVALALSPLQQVEGDFSGMIVVFDDLTQLMKAQKLATWKEIAQRVAHEIKNPLTPIQLSAERIIKTLGKSDRGSSTVIEEGAKTIIQEARTIKSLVDEFSNFARMPRVEPKPADLRALIDQAVGLFRGLFSDVRFQISVDPELPGSLPLDAEQMKRVFINLFDNAIEAMDKKGEITVRASFEKKRQQVRIDVADTGPGISPEDRTKIFLPYFSTKKKGAGLGLAIVSQIIRDHNGSIRVETNDPYGARFVIEIPA